MERTHSLRALRLAIATGLGLCLSLPLAAQDANMANSTQASRQADRADKAGTASTSTKAADKRFLDKATKDNEKEVAAATLGQQKAGSPDVRDYATQLLRDHQDMLVKLDETAVALGVSNDRRYVAMSGWGSGARGEAMASGTGSAMGPGERTDLTDTTTAAGGTSTAGSVTGRGTTTSTTSSVGTGTGYDTGTMASTDRNASATSTTTQAVPASASQDPAVRKLAQQSGASFDRAFVDHMVADHKKAIAEFERASKDQSLSAESRTLASNALPKLRNHLALAETLRTSLKTSAQ